MSSIAVPVSGTESQYATNDVIDWIRTHPVYSAAAADVIHGNGFGYQDDELRDWFAQLLYRHNDADAPPYAIARSLDDLAKRFTEAAFWNIDWTVVRDAVLVEGD